MGRLIHKFQLKIITVETNEKKAEESEWELTMKIARTTHDECAELIRQSGLHCRLTMSKSY